MGCKECTKRYPGCHDHCPDYQAAVVDRIKRKQWLERSRLRTSRDWVKDRGFFKMTKGGDT